MPDESKQELRAARVNIILARYIGVIFLSSVFLGFILAGSYFLLDQTRQSAQLLIDSNDTKAEIYSATKSQVDTLSTSLSGAKTILDQETLYSKALINIAQQMPEGTVIEKIELHEAAFNGEPLTIKVYAKTADSIADLGQKFQSSPFFTNVTLGTISDGSAGINGYPVSATVTLALNRTVAK